MSLNEAVKDYEKADVTPESNAFSTVPKEDTCTIIVPLYGYYRDSVIKGLDAEVLRVSLLRLRSFYHKVYYVFVGERGRVDSSVYNVLIGKSMSGNTLGVEVEQNSTYSTYLDEGLKFALERTTSKYFICVNPWLLTGKNTVDTMIERVNKTDIAVCSSYDFRKAGVDAAVFDNYKYNPAREYRDSAFDINFFGFTRPVAEKTVIDVTYRTREYLEQDMFQTFHSKGHNIVISQNMPIYSFEFDWSLLESEEDSEIDKAYFQKKWGFLPVTK